MDRDRFRARARELRAFADRMIPLAKMPDRATSADLQLAADLAAKAADAIDDLVTATPTGCICRRIQDDNCDFLDYAESCRHHGSLFARVRQLKEGYAKIEKALRDEARMKLVAAALAGSATMPVEDDVRWHDRLFIERALAIADETIRQIAEGA